MNVVYHFKSIKNPNTDLYEDYPIILGLLKEDNNGNKIVGFE